MYFAHRKGWIESNDNILKENYIDGLKKRGLKYIVILKKSFGSMINLNFKIQKYLKKSMKIMYSLIRKIYTDFDLTFFVSLFFFWLS